MKVEDLDKLLEAEAPRYAKSGEMTPELMALLFVDDYYVGSPDLEYVSVEGNVVKYTFPVIGDETDEVFKGKVLVFTITFE